VVHLAPPPAEGALDRRTRNLTAILPEQGAWFMSAPPASMAIAAARCSTKAARWRRATRARCAGSMPSVLRRWAQGSGAALSILRVPGIYAAERLPLKRLRRARRRWPRPTTCTPTTSTPTTWPRLLRVRCSGRPNRIYHAVDDSEMKMAEYFDAVADAYDLPRRRAAPR
jgi:hypothetical protein